MKKNIKFAIGFGIIVIYFIFGKLTGLYIPCMYHEVFHVYCPGCGITRMFKSLFHLDFVSAFRYNMLAFICLPFFLFLVIECIISNFKDREALYKRIPHIVWYILIGVFILFGILRNIYPVLAPID